MNRRTLKKHCKRAMEVLIAKHGYTHGAFLPADGEEALYAPARMERRFVRRDFLEPGPLKGTPLLWSRCAPECDDFDCDLPSEVLAEIEFWQNWKPTPEDLAAWEAK